MKCELKYIKHGFTDSIKDILNERKKICMLILFVITFNLMCYISKLIFGFSVILYIGIIFTVIGLLIVYVQAVEYCKKYNKEV